MGSWERENGKRPPLRMHVQEQKREEKREDLLAYSPIVVRNGLSHREEGDGADSTDLFDASTELADEVGFVRAAPARVWLRSQTCRRDV